ncbi:MAG: electron transfer flavoprotein subunit beta/FixA family protein [Nitrospirae bacterium]|nr:electron transfer flavoprotein subunit beta/FixA family protein [Nitrospirota bacterium]MBI3352254.1 electron transfer flavoprotein subunit beta/FixA family protein [Nitrospirota bacterium]
MNILVCLKQVPSSESKIKVGKDPTGIDTSDLTYVVNPYDEYGVEEAIRIKERLGSVDITVLSVGPATAAETLRVALAMGVDRAVLLYDPLFSNSDSLGIARIIAAYVHMTPFDLIFFGKQAIDDDMGAVGIMVAELLRLPHGAVVNRLEISPDQKSMIAHRQIEGADEILEILLPAVITCQKGLNEPRYPSLPGIMKAKSKPLAEINHEGLKLDPKTVGLSAALVKIVKLFPPKTRTTGKIIEGPPAEAVKELVQHLSEATGLAGA